MRPVALSGRQFDNFWGKIDTNNRCWLWRGAKTTKGYGHLTLNGRDFQAHRIAYALFKGTIPTGHCVLHKCDVRACVKPNHLFTGTVADNNADKLRKNRQTRGEKHGPARLTSSEVIEIRVQHASGASYADLAERFDMSATHISNIVKRRKWRHI